MIGTTRRAAFWEILTRFEKHKINPWIALRNAIGVALPVAIGAAMGRAGSGLVMTTGALYVAFSDGSDPYPHRARRMVAAGLCCSLAVLAGGLAGRHHALAAMLAALLAFCAGMLAAVGPVAADIGTITLVTYLVFSAQGMTPRQTAVAASLALAGSVIQTILALAMWPLRRYAPERRALAALYSELAKAAESVAIATEAPPASSESTEAQQALVSLGGDASIEAQRYLALLSQAERMRLTLLTLSRLRARMERENPGSGPAATIGRALTLAGSRLDAIAESLRTGHDLTDTSDSLSPLAVELRDDARSQLEALAGQLRSAVQLGADATPAGNAQFEQREAQQPWRLRFTGALAALQANLHLDSAAFRHALRMAVCVAIGDIAGRALDPRRGYWATMTIAIILKPDFTSTFSRGLLRLAGTFAGLGLATALFHFLAPALAAQVILIAAFAYLLRCFGPAHYGVFVTVLTALVVVMFAVTGIDPSQVILSRAINTVSGGLIALAVYALWPTWEHRQVGPTLARLLDAYRDYFHWVFAGYLKPESSYDLELENARLAGRLARSNLEASIARLHAEPGVPADRLAVLNAILANSHRFIRAAMSLEAALQRSPVTRPRESLRIFAGDVERNLEILAAALRGSTTEIKLPDLREDHCAVSATAGPGSLLTVETDRITNSLNTLSGEVRKWLGPS